MQLTAMDVHHLIKDPSGVPRSALAAKVAHAYSDGQFSQKEAVIAGEIFRLLLKDTERAVRESLAEYLYNCPTVPHDVVFKLACDEETDIAARMLEYSSVLTEEDLISLVQSGQDLLRLTAIARRPGVSERVSDCLLDTHHVAVLNELFNNHTARFNEQALAKNWGLITSHHSLLNSLSQHGGLPLTIAEKLFHVVSEEMKKRISKQYKLHTPLLHKATADAREWELLGVMPINGILHPDDDERVEDLVDQLYATRRLTHSLLVRALCMGCIHLFEAGIARLANVPRVNARILLMGGPNGFRAIYKASGMPDGFADAMEKLIVIALELSEYGHAKPEDFRKRVFERVHIEGYQRTVENMPYLLSIIDGKLSGHLSQTTLH